MPPAIRNQKTAVARIAKRFGSMAELARAIGVEESIVRQWQSRRGGRVPDKHHAGILAAAKRLRVRINLRDFINA